MKWTNFVAKCLVSMALALGMACLALLVVGSVRYGGPGDLLLRARAEVAAHQPHPQLVPTPLLAASAAKGAPVDWLRLNPATVTPDLVALTKDSPHPNAGLLFVEFMTSKEGQQIFQKANYLPARPDVPRSRHYFFQSGLGLASGAPHV